MNGVHSRPLGVVSGQGALRDQPVWNRRFESEGGGLGSANNFPAVLKILVIAMMFAATGVTMAWVFEHLSTDFQFLPNGALSSVAQPAELRLTNG